MVDIPIKLKNGAQTVYFKAGGQWCYLRTPNSFHVDNPPIPCVIQCHGNRGYVKNGEADWLIEKPKRLFLDILNQNGIAVSGSHGTGNHWGRPSAVTANAMLFTSLSEHPNINQDNIGLMGGGLGGAVIWNTVTGPLLGKVNAVVLQQATLSYESVIRNRKFKGPLLRAYGIPASTPNKTAIETLSYNDPIRRTQILAKEYPGKAVNFLPKVLFVHGDEDENMLYLENPIALSKILDQWGADYSFHTFKGVGHATYDLGETAAQPILKFFLKTFKNS